MRYATFSDLPRNIQDAIRNEESHHGSRGMTSISASGVMRLAVMRMANRLDREGEKRRNQVSEISIAPWCGLYKEFTEQVGSRRLAGRAGGAALRILYMCAVTDRGVIVQLGPTDPITIHETRNGLFLYGPLRDELIAKGVPRAQAIREAVCRLPRFRDERNASRTMTIRSAARLLRLNGFDARVVNQTMQMVSEGSGDNVRSKKDSLRGISTRIVVPDGVGGWIHCDHRHTPANLISTTLATRRIREQKSDKAREEQALLDEWMYGDCGDPWVYLSDSTAGGNCEVGTRAWALIWIHRNRVNTFGARVEAIRMSELMASMEGNDKVRAAIIAALRRLKGGSNAGRERVAGDLVSPNETGNG